MLGGGNPRIGLSCGRGGANGRDRDILPALLRGNDRAAEITGKCMPQLGHVAVVGRRTVDRVRAVAAVRVVEILGWRVVLGLKCIDQRTANPDASEEA
ncbi:MAG TPA: hypothetical protein PLQ12_04105, partial [Candidatus Defluviicoccus seviourii]|nr:hypothetical protein [Candidatus Defluviicoccus seviourii]